mmetsp:Transcript_5610/g.19943  ORF Transcript_5610/g.19943 Transcript_5610/m.19943 type:complete len:302 (+) Transcript_5610:253-1158(+)
MASSRLAAPRGGAPVTWPQPRETTTPTRRCGQTALISWRARSVGLLKAQPPSARTCVPPSAVGASDAAKYVGAADVAAIAAVIVESEVPGSGGMAAAAASTAYVRKRYGSGRPVDGLGRAATAKARGGALLQNRDGATTSVSATSAPPSSSCTSATRSSSQRWPSSRNRVLELLAKHRSCSASNAAAALPELSLPKLAMNSAPQPPMLVPQTTSKRSATGRPVLRSSSRTVTRRLRPLVPPPSRQRTRSGGCQKATSTAGSMAVPQRSRRRRRLSTTARRAAMISSAMAVARAVADAVPRR